MNKETIVRVAQIVNIILMVCFSPIMFFIFLFALSDVVDHASYVSPRVIMTVGYLMAVIFGLFSLKKKQLLFVSLIGWGLVWWGDYADKADAQAGDRAGCVLIRQDSHCVENADGDMQCQGGEFSGVYPGICLGIPR